MCLPKPLPIRFPIPQRVLRDNHLLHVGRAFDDLIGLGVAVVVLDRKFGGITVSTKDLHRRIGGERCRSCALSFTVSMV